MFPDWEHLILCDTERNGCAGTVNQLARAASGEWLLILADDDLLLPGCLTKLLSSSGAADIVHAPPLVFGEDPAQFYLSPPAIPATCLIRRSLWIRVGGYDEGMTHTEDRDFYERAITVGARFHRVDYPCWVYRFWGGNKSRGHD